MSFIDPRRRPARMLVLLAFALLAPGAVAGAQSPATGADGAPQALLSDCHVAVVQADRYATIEGQMAALPNGPRMQMRMDLEQRTAGGGARVLDAPGLGTWERSAPGVGVLRTVHHVVNLPAPASLRVLVRFRWLDDQGRVVQRATRLSPACLQPDERARIVAGPLRATSNGSSGARYAVVLRNTGRGPTGPFDVVLDVNGSPQPAQQIDDLEPAQRVVAQLLGPACAAGSTVRAVVDPGGVVAEAPGGGAPASVPCPSDGAGGSSGG